MISFSLAVEVFQIIQLKGNQICGCPFHPCISSKCQYILPTTNYSFILRYTCKHSLLFISLQNTMMHNKIHNVPFTNRVDIWWLNDGYVDGCSQSCHSFTITWIGYVCYIQHVLMVQKETSVATVIHVVPSLDYCLDR